MPPKVEGLCDVCGSKLIVRDDDFYKDQGLLEQIDIDIYSKTTKEDTTKRAEDIIEKRK